MGRSDTTHVLEIESGIGEPAFIPLSLGSELQPISVGKKGMWRIESPRVLDVHAFVYFDGNTLFVQSADDRAAAIVEGQTVGTTWTEIEEGCRIEIGQARLRFRSLLPAEDDQAETHAMDRAPVAKPLPPPTPSMAPVLPRKPERPFRPGELATHEGETTRIAPLDGTKRHNRADLESAVRAAPGGAVMPSGGYGSMGMPASAGPPPAPMMMQGSPMPVMHTPYPGMVGADPNAVPGTAMMPHGAAPSVPAMHGMMAHGAYPSGAYPGAEAYAHAPSHPPSGPMPLYPGQGMPPNMPPGAHPPDPNAPKDFATRWKEMPGPRRLLILLSPVFLMSAWLLLTDDPPPPSKSTRGAGSGSAAATARATAPVAQPQPGVPVAQPQPGVPVAQPQPGVPVAQPQPGVPVAQPQPGVPPAIAEAPAPPVPANAKTYERIAIDAYLAGDYATAARIYTQLGEQSQPPSNIVYLEAARIIRAKLDAGAPR